MVPREEKKQYIFDFIYYYYFENLTPMTQSTALVFNSMSVICFNFVNIIAVICSGVNRLRSLR
jgi:hypothetical protein